MTIGSLVPEIWSDEGAESSEMARIRAPGLVYFSRKIDFERRTDENLVDFN